MSVIFADQVSDQFVQRVRAIAERLDTDPNFLMAVMAFESAGTFSPRVRNPHSGATGLIQFMPSTARALGTTVDALAQQSAEEQLHYVERYLRPYRGRMQTLSDVYMAVLWPRAVGAAPGTVLFDEVDGALYRQNRGLDANRDGAVTKAEAAASVQARYDAGQKALCND